MNLTVSSFMRTLTRRRSFLLPCDHVFGQAKCDSTTHYTCPDHEVLQRRLGSPNSSKHLAHGYRRIARVYPKARQVRNRVVLMRDSKSANRTQSSESTGLIGKAYISPTVMPIPPITPTPFTPTFKCSGTSNLYTMSMLRDSAGGRL